MLLFVIASVYSRVRVRLSWFVLVCLHRPTNSVRIIKSNKPNRIYNRWVFWTAVEALPFCRGYGSLCEDGCVFLIFFKDVTECFCQCIHSMPSITHFVLFCAILFVFELFMVVVVVVVVVVDRCV